ncbi:restriction endonuclease subunit S [Deinococcus antarcticus]|uniref:Restriction endonuclease subunit S n=1 Tax=Deinococcus antarcticus TaxID=1298767 RepID=A0ABV8A433_9DEIO
MTWERVPIGLVVLPIKRWNPAKAAPDDEFDYIDLSSVDKETKKITEAAKYIGSEAPNRAQQLVKGNDILVATVRPNLNGVAFVEDEFNGATASTGYCVSRPDISKIDSRYLFHWVKTKEFIEDMTKKATGANYPAVSDSVVKASEIPLPPLPIQRRIAAVLDEVDALRQKRERSIERLCQLREATYINHLQQHQGSSQQVKVSDLINPSKGGMRTGPFGSQLLHSEFVDDPDGIMVLGIDNAVKNRFQYAGERYITAEKYTKLKRYTVYPGDVLVTIMGTCGRVAIVPDDIPTAINTKHLCAMTLNERCLPEFLHATLTYNPDVLRQMGASARGAIMDGLNMGIISNLEFPLLSIAAQQELKNHFDEIDTLTEITNATQEHEAQLLASLQARAFAGELEFGAWELTAQDAQTFTEALINPASPNDALREAAGRSKESLG